MKARHEEMPSGKRVIRLFNDGGQLISEMHAIGAVDIALTMEFSDGVKVGETFVVKNRVVSRDRYERARVPFPDMPAPDVTVGDIYADLMKTVRRERRTSKVKHVQEPDTEKASQIDNFCRKIMERGLSADAVKWVKSPENSLGELSNAASRSLIARLLRLGSATITACEIVRYDANRENAGNLVLELPSDADRRRAILQEIDRLASRQGNSGDPDYGQSYAYLKLD